MTEPTTFGIDPVEINQTYEDARTEARKVYDAAVSESARKFNNAARDVRVLFRDQYETGESIVSLINVLTLDERTTMRRNARAIYDAAVEVAQAAKREALEAEPFTRFVETVVRDDYSEDYADTLNRHSPLTFDRLKQLANDEGWCGDYEYAMNRAVREGALPDETVEHRFPVKHLSNIPDSYGAQPGERWEHVAQIKAFARTKDRHDQLRSVSALREYVVSETFEKVADAPAEAE